MKQSIIEKQIKELCPMNYPVCGKHITDNNLKNRLFNTRDFEPIEIGHRTIMEGRPFYVNFKMNNYQRTIIHIGNLLVAMQDGVNPPINEIILRKQSLLDKMGKL